MGTVVASTSMQFAYAGVPLSLSLLLNLANRRRIEVVTHQRAMGAVVRVQQQLSQDLVAIEQRLRQVAERHQTESPTQSQLRLQQLHQLAQHTSDSQTRIRDLDDFRLVYQEIVSLQEQHRHVYESLAATIDYLNDSPLPQRVDEIEAAIAQIRRDFGLMNDRLAHSMPIDVTRHVQSDSLDDLSGDFDDLDHLQVQNQANDPNLKTDFAGEVLDQIFETERQRDTLERRTITLPLEQFAARTESGLDSAFDPDSASQHESNHQLDDDPSLLETPSFTAASGFAATFATNSIASPSTTSPTPKNLATPAHGLNSAFADEVADGIVGEIDDGIFDADILTDETTDRDSVSEMISNPDSVVERMSEDETTIRDTRDQLEAPATEFPSQTKRPTIELFSPNASPLIDPEPAPNAIPPFDLDQDAIEPTHSPTNSPTDPLIELTRTGTTPVSFALTTPSPTTQPNSNHQPSPAGINLPAIDTDTVPANPPDLPSNPSVPPQDWQRISTLTDHGDWVSDLAIDPTGEMLISASFDRTIQLWDLQSGESLNVLSEHSSPVCAIALSRSQGWLVSGSWDRTIKIWDLDTQALLETLVDDSGVAGSVRSLAVSPNGRFIASGWFDRTIAIWDVRITPKRRKVSVSACGSQLAHSGRVDAIAFDPTGKLLASASADGTIKLWSVDGNTGELELVNTLADSADPINAVTFSRDGMALIDANRDRTIRIWDVETGERLHKLTGHNSSVTALAAHPDGETLISGSSDGTVRLWHIPTGQAISTLSGSRDAVMSVAVSDDGRVLVSGSADGSIDVWRRWGMAELPM